MSEKLLIIEEQSLESIYRSIADTNEKLIGTEIGKLLNDSRVIDVDLSLPKWKRLCNAFACYQNKLQCSTGVLTFTQKALQPVRYIRNENEFHRRRNEINHRLYFLDYELGQNVC